jgi:hypothetical protein
MPRAAAIHFDGRRIAERDHVHLPPTAWTTASATAAGAGQLQGAVQWSGWDTAKFRHEFQLAGIEPRAPALRAVVDLDALELDDDQRFMALGAHGADSGRNFPSALRIAQGRRCVSAMGAISGYKACAFL